MCNIFGKPKMPEIVYQGPSQEELDANQAKLDLFIENSEKQNKTFTDALQVQIDNAAATTKTLTDELAALKTSHQNTVASYSGPAAGQTYAVTTKQTDPENAQTTTTIKPKKKDKNKSTLKVSQNSVQNTSGSGVNVGV